MLNIYCARESINREKYMFERVKNTRGNNLVIVPDQYTLESEKQAFRYMETDVILDTEIISISRLGSRLVNTYGGGDKTFISRYGRHMLLTKILKENEDKLKIYGGSIKKTTFIDALNDFIAEMKQGEVTPEMLQETAEKSEGNFRERLDDISLIFSEYEKCLEGKYTDTEDYIELYASKIGEAEFIRESTIWIYGFDSFTKKNLRVVEELVLNAKEVNIFLICDRNCEDSSLFELSEIVIRNLKEIGENAGIETRVLFIPEEYAFDGRAEGIRTVEKKLFSIRRESIESSEGVSIVRCINPYREAEEAASFILHLVRDRGFRYRDIAVINNDAGERASILRRVFEEYGIGVFEDNKRPVLSSPMAVFTVSLVETVALRYPTPGIFRVLKTGFTEVSTEDVEKLENYGIKYKIRGTMWKKPFTIGEFEYGEKGMAEIEDIRKRSMKVFEDFEKIYKKSETFGIFITEYYDFLENGTKLKERTRELIQNQQEAGFREGAEETAQIWREVTKVFEEMAELMAEEPFDGREFVDLVTAGLSQVQIGVIPPTSDDVIIGTMQRTRTGDTKAVLVTGANEGLIPLAKGEDLLFSGEELCTIAGGEKRAASDITVMEENLAIYRNLSKPSDFLRISYSSADTQGGELVPSSIIGSISMIFSGLVEERAEKRVTEETLGGRINTLSRFAEAVRSSEKGEEISPIWKEVSFWLDENAPNEKKRILEGITGSRREVLSEEIARDLYIRSDDGEEYLKLSPSSIEKYSRCPFSHFVSYGLRPEERRIYEGGGREIGDIYHNSIMKISQKFTEEDIWDTVSEEECRQLVHRVIREEGENYRDGVFGYGNGEKYKLDRAEAVLHQVVKALVMQYRAGDIQKSGYEVEFKRGKTIPPIEKKFDDFNAYIEGKIDRVDILDSGRVKIIDYKTGNENFNFAEAERGYRLQLMLYLKAAEEQKRKPAGVFYFLIKEPGINEDSLKPGEDIESTVETLVKKSFKMDGIMVDDKRNIEEIAGNSFDRNNYSDMVGIRRKYTKPKKKDPDQSPKVSYSSTSNADETKCLVSEFDFRELEKAVDETVERLCRDIISGRIEPKPMKSGKKNPCTFCEYRGICKFDVDFPGCRYEIIR